MVKERYTRKMSFNERLFVACNEICPPVANQLFFDGVGELDRSRWLKAVEIASEANPGSRVVLEGHLGFSRWVDSGITPRVREVDGSHWDGLGPEGAPFLQESLPYRESPTCEVVLIQGAPLRVVFRTHHGVMDARGTLVWASDIFRALRGEAVIGSCSTLTDVELVKSFQKQMRKTFPLEHIPPSGKAVIEGEGVQWKRRHVPGKFSRVLPQCARLIAEEAWRHGEGTVRFGIPVDLRLHREGLRSTANLSFALYIEVKPETTVEQIAADIAFQLKHGYEGMLSLGDELFSHVPLALMRSQALRIIRKRHRKGIYSLSGVLSNLGRENLAVYEGGGFKATSFWAIPPRNEYHPLFLVMAGYGDNLELMLSMPKVLADGGRLDEILERLAQGVQKND